MRYLGHTYPKASALACLPCPFHRVTCVLGDNLSCDQPWPPDASHYLTLRPRAFRPCEVSSVIREAVPPCRQQCCSLLGSPRGSERTLWVPGVGPAGTGEAVVSWGQLPLSIVGAQETTRDSSRGPWQSAGLSHVSPS